MSLSKDYAWYIQDDKIGIVEYNTDNSVSYTGWISITTAGKTIRALCVTRPSDVIGFGASTSPDIPEQFHDILMYKVISLGYMSPPNLDPKLAEYFDNKYKEGIREIKRFVRSHKRKDITIQLHEY